MNKVLLFFTNKYKGDWEKIYYALNKKEEISYIDAKKSFNKLKDSYLCLVDSKYPDSLKTLYKPPFSLFLDGNKELLNKKDKYLTLLVNDIDLSLSLKKDILKHPEYIYIVDLEYTNLINFLLKNNIKFICVSSVGIKLAKKENLYKEIIKSNNLIISEIPNNINTYYDDQSNKRIMIGLSKKIIFDNKTLIDFNDIVLVLKREEIQAYWYSNKHNWDFISTIKSIGDLFNSNLLH